MPPKPSYFNLSNLLALAVLFIVSLSVGVADFSWRYALSLKILKI